MSQAPPPYSHSASQHHLPQPTPPKTNTNTALLSTLAILYLLILYINPGRPLDLLNHVLTRLRGMLGLNKSADLLVKVPQALGAAASAAGSEGIAAGVVGKVRKASTGVLARMQGRSDGDAGVDVPAGLGNWDNSCYQNCVLQGLAGLEAVRPFLGSMVQDAEGEGGEESTAGSLLNTLRRLNDPGNNGRMLWTPAKLKNMSSWQQQDAQEYFSKILEEVEKEAAKAFSASATAAPLSASRTLGLEALIPNTKSTIPTDQPAPSQQQIKNPLDGLLAQKVTCTACDHSTGLSLIPFNCLTLPLPLQTEPTDLQACLDEYTKRESIPQVECAKCTLLHARDQLAAALPADPRFQSTDPACDAEETSHKNKKQKKEKEIMQLPPELRAQSFLRLAALQNALSAEDFADKTLTELCGISRQERVSSTKTREAMVARAPRCLVLHVNRSVFDEVTGVLRKNYVRVGYPSRLEVGRWMGGLGEDGHGHADGREEKQEDGVTFVLKAVVTHYGRHENGHYICYRRHPRIVRRVLKEEDDDDDDHDAEEEGEAEDAVDQLQDGEVEEKEPDPWYRLSDEDVTPVQEDDVLSQGGVFMLFYEREDLSNEKPPQTPSPPDKSAAEASPVRDLPATAGEAAVAVSLTPEIEPDTVSTTPQDTSTPPAIHPENLTPPEPDPAAATPPPSSTTHPTSPSAPSPLNQPSTPATTDSEPDPDVGSEVHPIKTQDVQRKSQTGVSTSPVRMRTARGMEGAAVDGEREGDRGFGRLFMTSRVAAT